MTNKVRRALALAKIEMNEGAAADKEALMEAMVAACAAIAFADGRLDIRERRRIFTLMQTNPIFTGFSHADVAGEFERQAHAFEDDYAAAKQEALFTIKALGATRAEARVILDACQQVLEADGVRDREEVDTLAEIYTALTAAPIEAA
jgi:tellurite resistance protein TerB